MYQSPAIYSLCIPHLTVETMHILCVFVCLQLYYPTLAYVDLSLAQAGGKRVEKLASLPERFEFL